MTATSRDSIRQATRGDAAAALAVIVAAVLFISSRYAVTEIGGFVTPAFALGILAALWWACARVTPGLGRAVGAQPVRLALFILVWAAAASATGLLVRPYTAEEGRAFEAGMLLLLSWAGIALLAADGLRDRARLDWLLRWVAVGTCAVAVIVMLQYFAAFDLTSRLQLPGLSAVPGAVDFIRERSALRRVAGTAAHPIEMGVVLALVLPLALHYSRFPGVGRRRVYQVAAAAILFASFLTISRTAVVAIAVEALVLVPTWPRRLQVGAVAGAAATVVAVRVAAPGVVGTILGLFLRASSDDSVTHRTDDYARAAGYIAGSPWFGRGLHTFLPDQYFFIDNSYLLALLETGFIGLAATTAFLAVGVGVARGARRRSRDAAGRDLGQCLAASILAAMATTATYDSFAFPMVTTLTFLLVGCAGALWRFEGGVRAHAFRPVAMAAPV